MCLICAHSPLSDLLDKEDYTLEQVLEEDELIQEVKSRNVKLLQFLSKEETVRKLVYYVTRKAEDGDGDMIAIKYPFMSCEVLCCDIMCITETLSTASNGAIVEDLFGLLSQPAPLNSRLAGYFEKVILSLLMIRKPQEVTELMNKNADTLLDGFVTHSISYSIAEMFKRLMQPYQGDYMDDMDFSHPYGSNGGPWFSSSSDEDDLSAVGTPQSKKTLSWQTDRRVVDSLVQNLRPADDKDDPIDSDVHKHTAEILSDIIHYGTRSSANEPAPASATLVEHIESAETVDKIIALALPAGNAYTTSMTSALTVLSALLSRHANTHYSSTIPEETPVVVSATVARLPQNIIALCLDLFFTFESVNMLHAEIELLVVGILESGGPDLQVGLLKQSNLLGRILQAYETNTAALQESPANAKGYMGHLLRISNVILNITDEVKGVDTRGSLNDMTHADSIVEYLEADPMWAQWDEFVKTTVADANDKDRHALGGSVVSHPVNIQTLSQDDPYGIGRFDHPPIGSFADMLESGDQSHFDTDFDLPQDNDIPAMISDSSSSDEDEDFTEFDPRSIHRSNHPQDSNAIPVVPLDSPDLVMEQADKSMDNSNWANFDAVAPSSQEYVVSCGGACLRSV
ncbi:hypothetical protein DYB31_001607 [Aphanomyces astaci]|uniref:Uncharacterized protein n=1 Tax=Aphanomyces astaci TaxID=112090 RepID=A0A397EZ13_APHAT|nr:hypothetical protein DYB31_001607 [Aphanomyces astaci]